MPETKQISTSTQLNIDESSISIIVSYLKDELPNIIETLITIDSGNRNSVPYIMGQLLIDVKNYPTDIQCYIDSFGNLILIGDDVANYSIDQNGNLIYEI